MKPDSVPQYEYSDIPRPRHNVLDVMDIVVPTVIPVPLTFDIDVSYTEALRKKFTSKGLRVAITAILLKAIGIAQRAHPATRTAQTPTGKMVTFNEITAGFTVERIISGTPAVFFGTIKNVDSKSIRDIAAELCAYASAPVESIPQLKLQIQTLDYPRWIRKLILHACVWFPKLRLKMIPATYGVSSIGKWGCKTGQPPCLSSTTFGVGEVQQRAIIVNGEVEARPCMTVTYIFDHKIIDGGPACRFMKDITDLLQGGLAQYVKEELEELERMPVPAV